MVGAAGLQVEDVCCRLILLKNIGIPGRLPGIVSDEGGPLALGRYLFNGRGFELVPSVSVRAAKV